MATPRRKRLRIAGRVVGRGESADIHLKFSESYLGTPVTIPIHVINSNRPGPRVLITGTIHGDELIGLGIVRQLLYGTPPKLKCGTLVCVPVVNVYGLENHSRYLPDRRDLNRCFPGIRDGSPSSRLAHDFFNEVVLQCDYGIDFHTAAVRMLNYPNVRADMNSEAVRGLARAFGSELIVHGRGPVGSFRRAACEAGVPTIILEAGEVWKLTPDVIGVGMRGIMNVLKWLKMIDGTPERPLFQTTIKKTSWIRADHGGIMGFQVPPGDLVEQGQELATNYSVFGAEHNVLTSPFGGVVLGMTTMPAVKPGEPIYHVAELSRSTLRRVQKRIEEHRGKPRFERISDVMASDIMDLKPEGGG